MQNILDNEINEFEEKVNKPKKDKIDDNKLSMKAINTNEGFYNSQIVPHSDIKKFVFNTEENLNTLEKKEKEKGGDNDIIDMEYEDIMEMTDEGKEEEIRRRPHVSGIIHIKSQLEKSVHLPKVEEDKSNCLII